MISTSFNRLGSVSTGLNRLGPVSTGLNRLGPAYIIYRINIQGLQLLMNNRLSTWCMVTDVTRDFVLRGQVTMRAPGRHYLYMVHGHRCHLYITPRQLNNFDGVFFQIGRYKIIKKTLILLNFIFHPVGDRHCYKL